MSLTNDELEAQIVDLEARVTKLEPVVVVPPPPPPPPKVLTITTNYKMDRLTKGTAVIATALLDGVAQTSGVSWAAVPGGVVTISGEPLNKLRITGAAPGTAQITAKLADGTSASVPATVLSDGTTVTPPVVVPPSPTPTPTPVPVPAQVAPAALWKRLRDHILLVATDFYYNWTTEMEEPVALTYDLFISGDPARHARMKVFNPNGRFIPYCLQYTSIIKDTGTSDSLASCFQRDFEAWCLSNKIMPAAQEAAWLHDSTGARIVVTIWGSKRHVMDPTSSVTQQYMVDRFTRLDSPAIIDGLFIDEFGSNQMTANYKLSSGTDLVRLAALQNAETSLIGKIAAAIAPKQLIVNTAAYMFPWDFDLSKAAWGTHMEQTNYPMNVDWWASTWTYIDRLLAAGVFVNFVPPFNFGEYESQHDTQVPANYLDTPRMKLVELCGAYMVTTDPALLGLHLENGDWAVHTPIQEHLPQVDAEIGRAIEPRQKKTLPEFALNKTTQRVYFTRRFSNGLVVVSPIWNRDPQNYGTKTVITLPTDRAYRQVAPDGTVGPVVTTVTLRCPEAAVFVVNA